MASKANFTPEEWSRVLASPMVAGTAITAADPSGLWGLLKEGMAGGWAMLKANQDANANPLIKAVAQRLEAQHARSEAQGRAFIFRLPLSVTTATTAMFLMM
jgi:hypothetical protein